MTAIWQNDGREWKLLSATTMPDEATLHALVEDAPQLLPLAGSPNLVVVGREVQLGAGYADLIAVEPTGRLVVLEIKLARNAEARRAVVSQAFAYAAYLYGLDSLTLERDVLGKHLQKRGFSSSSAAVASADQTGEYNPDSFAIGLSASLGEGRFRIVFVLDTAPEELVRLVAYLEATSDKVLIDLITIASYSVGGSTIVVPQRVEAERRPIESQPQQSRSLTTGRLEQGADAFIASVESAKPEDQPHLKEVVDWALDLEGNGLCELSTYFGNLHRWTLLPRIAPDNVGLVTVWNDGSAAIQFWRSVFERRAPHSLAAIEQLVAPTKVSQGNITRTITPELLKLLTDAYHEAKEVHINPRPT
jgi:hypothetical protein